MTFGFGQKVIQQRYGGEEAENVLIDSPVAFV